MTPDNRAVNGVWMGSRLTNIQKLCIRSYQNAGHDFHLWVTEPTAGVPEGTIVRDAFSVFDEPIPEFAGSNYFSDFFRVELIHKIGGWYVDLDTVCLRGFNFPSSYAFVSEPRLEEPMRDVRERPSRASTAVQPYFSGCIFKAPQGAPFLKYISDKIREMDTLHPPTWICMGPAMFQNALFRFDLTRHVQPPCVFDALNYNEYRHFLSENVMWNFSSASHAFHLRTSFWTKEHWDPDGVYPPGCLFEELKRKHGVKNE
jgi:hypothetical protein